MIVIDNKVFFLSLSCKLDYCMHFLLNTTFVIKFVSDLRQVGGFLRAFRFPPPIKLTAKI